MALFKHKVTGAIISRPAHYANHRVLGKNLELISEVETAQAVETASKKKKFFAKKTTEDAEPVVSEPAIEAVAESVVEVESVGVETPQEEIIDNNEEYK
jgi:hypothetical protein